MNLKRWPRGITQGEFAFEFEGMANFCEANRFKFLIDPTECPNLIQLKLPQNYAWPRLFDGRVRAKVQTNTELQLWFVVAGAPPPEPVMREWIKVLEAQYTGYGEVEGAKGYYFRGNACLNSSGETMGDSVSFVYAAGTHRAQLLAVAVEAVLDLTESCLQNYFAQFHQRVEIFYPASNLMNGASLG